MRAKLTITLLIILMVLVIAINLFLLGLVKYSAFFVTSINGILYGSCRLPCSRP